MAGYLLVFSELVSTAKVTIDEVVHTVLLHEPNRKIIAYVEAGFQKTAGVEEYAVGGDETSTRWFAISRGPVSIDLMEGDQVIATQARLVIKVAGTTVYQADVPARVEARLGATLGRVVSATLNDDSRWESAYQRHYAMGAEVITYETGPDGYSPIKKPFVPDPNPYDESDVPYTYFDINPFSAEENYETNFQGEPRFEPDGIPARLQVDCSAGSGSVQLSPRVSMTYVLDPKTFAVLLYLSSSDASFTPKAWIVDDVGFRALNDVFTSSRLRALPDGANQKIDDIRTV